MMLFFSVASPSLTQTVNIASYGVINDTLIVTAVSGYWRDIQNAVDQVAADGGGEVHIPAGTWDFVQVGEVWTGTGGQPRVSVPAGVSIFGAPNNRDSDGYNTEWNTILRLPSSVPTTWHNEGVSWFRATGSGINTPFTRFSDLKLVGYRSIDSNDKYGQTGIQLENMGEFQVDHCYFEHMCTTGVRVEGINIHGVINHCIFINPVGTVNSAMDDCDVFYGVCLGRTSAGDYWDPDIQNVLGHYTSYTVFIENCYFEKWRHCVSGNYGAHYVFRYCTINNDFGFGSLDAHSYGVEPNQVGTRATEIYNNQFINNIQYNYVTYIRGGAGVAFNNYVADYNQFIYLINEASWDKCWCRNWYIWNNTLIGCQLLSKNDPLGNIEEGSEYFFSQPVWYVPYQYPHPLTLENGITG